MWGSKGGILHGHRDNNQKLPSRRDIRSCWLRRVQRCRLTPRLPELNAQLFVQPDKLALEISIIKIDFQEILRCGRAMASHPSSVVGIGVRESYFSPIAP